MLKPSNFVVKNRFFHCKRNSWTSKSMSLPKYSDIKTIELDQLTSSQIPVIAAGQSKSTWFDAQGLTIFGFYYPYAVNGYQWMWKSKETVLPAGLSISSLEAPVQIQTGPIRKIIICTENPDSDTYVYCPIEPSITGGLRWLQVATLDSSGALVTQVANRLIIPKLRKV